MIPSHRAREAIKTALAMTLAYGIALTLNWDKPIWAAFAVAVISLATVGQSLNKGIQRLLGTLLGAVVSLTLLALFPQDRWEFMTVLIAFVGFCAYMMGGNKHQYFWNVGGFVTLIIAMGSIPATDNAFQLAVLRTQETGLGILVYTLVTVLLWPVSSRAMLDAAARQLAAAERQTYTRYYELMTHAHVETSKAPHALRMQEGQTVNALTQALNAAEMDSHEVWAMRRRWWQFQKQSIALLQALEGWQESFKEIQGFDLNRLLPQLNTLHIELERRFAQIERMLAGDAPESIPQIIDLQLDQNASRSLSHFHKAAFTIVQIRLLRIEALTRSLFETVQDLKGFPTAHLLPSAISRPSTGFIPDPDRATAAIQVMASVWLAFLLWIYIEVPGGSSFIVLSGSLGMTLASMPQISVSLVLAPTAAGILFACALYVFVMPQLSSFVGLGALIFAVTFAAGYLFHTPQQAILRLMGIMPFVVITGITNQQNYNFLAAANTALMLFLMYALLALTTYIPFSPQPEKVFLRLLGRFFRSSEALLFTMRWNPTDRRSLFEGWKKAYHLQQITTLPAKLATWSPFIDTGPLAGATKESVQALTSHLQAISYRLQYLVETREQPQTERLARDLSEVARDLLQEMRAWRLGIQNAFQILAQNPGAASASQLHDQLTARIECLENCVQETLNKAEGNMLSERDNAYFYGLLGGYRSLSEAVIEYAQTAVRIDWKRWREPRF